MKSFKKYFVIYSLLITFLSSCNGKKQDISTIPLPPTIVVTEFPSNIITKTTPTPTPIFTFPTNPITEAPFSPEIACTKHPSPTPKSLLVPTKLPEKTPSPILITPVVSSVPDIESSYDKNAWLASIKLSEENFPDKAFRTLISQIVDKDNNGILTLEERETLTYLRDTFYMGDPEDSEPCEPDFGSNDYQMAKFLPNVKDFTGIEYFPQLKIFSRHYGESENKSWHPINLSGLPNLEEFYFRANKIDPESTYYFNFGYLPQLKSIQIKIENTNASSYVTLKKIENLKEFWIDGNVATLDGLEDTTVEKLILKLGKQNKNIPMLSIETAESTINLAKFLNLKELHFCTDFYTETYTFTNGSNLELLAIGTPGGMVTLQNIPNLYEVRVLGGKEIKNKNCPNINCLRLGMSGEIEQLDLNSFNNLKILEVAWDTTKIKNLLLPNDKVNIITDTFGNVETTIFYQEQSTFQEMCQTLETTFAKSPTLSGSSITYEPIAAETFSTPGIFKFICTPEHGYQIDLNGDGITENLYSDFEDFYINGKRLGITRNDNLENEIWSTFWILVSDEITPKYKIIINTAPLERFYTFFDGIAEASPEYYWSSGVIYGWGVQTNFQRFKPNYYIGQFLLFYDEFPRLQAYAESNVKSYHTSTTPLPICYPFVEAIYDTEKISFSHIKKKWIRVYGTGIPPSLYFQDDSWEY